MNANNLKDNLSKIKASVWYKNIINERLLTALKSKAPLYVDGAGLTNNKEKSKKRMHP